jgi:hypothetical protein
LLRKFFLPEIRAGKIPAASPNDRTPIELALVHGGKSEPSDAEITKELALPDPRPRKKSLIHAHGRNLNRRLQVISERKDPSFCRARQGSLNLWLGSSAREKDPSFCRAWQGSLNLRLGPSAREKIPRSAVHGRGV